MSLPADLPGQVAHVFMSSPQRDVLLNMAKAIEQLQKNAPLAALGLSGFSLPAAAGSPYPIKEGDDVSAVSES